MTTETATQECYCALCQICYADTPERHATVRAHIEQLYSERYQSLFDEIYRRENWSLSPQMTARVRRLSRRCWREIARQRSKISRR